MSNNRIINLKNNKLIKIEDFNTDNIYNDVLNNLKELFGVTLIGSNINISDNKMSNDNYTCEILGYDESFKLVLFEFRKDKYDVLIKKALMTIDYIKAHSSIVLSMIKDSINPNDYSHLDLNARLIVIGEDFSKADEYAIKQTPYEIDLISVNKFKDNLLINKTYQNYQVRIDNYDSLIKNKLFYKLHNDIIELGDEINATGINNFINYRRILNFCYVLINEDITVYIRNNGKLNNYNLDYSNYNKIFGLIKKAYEEN